MNDIEMLVELLEICEKFEFAKDLQDTLNL